MWRLPIQVQNTLNKCNNAAFAQIAPCLWTASSVVHRFDSFIRISQVGSIILIPEWYSTRCVVLHFCKLAAYTCTFNIHFLDDFAIICCAYSCCLYPWNCILCKVLIVFYLPRFFSVFFSSFYPLFVTNAPLFVLRHTLFLRVVIPI